MLIKSNAFFKSRRAENWLSLMLYHNPSQKPSLKKKLTDYLPLIFLRSFIFHPAFSLPLSTSGDLEPLIFPFKGKIHKGLHRMEKYKAN